MLTLVFVLVSQLGNRPEASAAVPGPVGIGGSWRAVFVDDFNNGVLNNRLWSTGWFGSGVTGPVGQAEPACYDPRQIQFRGDATVSIQLIRKAQWCSGATRPYTTGLLSTNGKFDYAYGVNEARLYLPPNAAGQPLNWPAFWTDGQVWPQDGENDVMESMAGSTGPHFHSPAGGPGFAAPGLWGGWHTFGSVWEPGRVSYYYDGRYVGAITSGITSAPMYLIVNFSAATDGSTQPATMRVDYVRVWQHT